jgi:hypothetical protein
MALSAAVFADPAIRSRIATRRRQATNAFGFSQLGELERMMVDTHDGTSWNGSRRADERRPEQARIGHLQGGRFGER